LDRPRVKPPAACDFYLPNGVWEREAHSRTAFARWRIDGMRPAFGGSLPLDTLHDSVMSPPRVSRRKATAEGRAENRCVEFSVMNPEEMKRAIEHRKFFEKD